MTDSSSHLEVVESRPEVADSSHSEGPNRGSHSEVPNRGSHSEVADSSSQPERVSVW